MLAKLYGALSFTSFTPSATILTPEKRRRVVVIMDNSESGDEVAAFMHSAEGTYITADGKNREKYIYSNIL